MCIYLNQFRERNQLINWTAKYLASRKFIVWSTKKRQINQSSYQKIFLVIFCLLDSNFQLTNKQTIFQTLYLVALFQYFSQWHTINQLSTWLSCAQDAHFLLSTFLYSINTLKIVTLLNIRFLVECFRWIFANGMLSTIFKMKAFFIVFNCFDTSQVKWRLFLMFVLIFCAVKSLGATVIFLLLFLVEFGLSAFYLSDVYLILELFQFLQKHNLSIF